MAIIYRRVFQAKTGASDPLVKVLKEELAALESQGYGAKVRLLTDYMSGRTDRVVEEVEASSLGEMEAVMGKLMADPNVRDALLAAEKRVLELVEYAEVEYWSIR